MNLEESGFMDVALEEARKSSVLGEVPVGAVIVANGSIVAKAGNRIKKNCDPSAHAEILAIRSACEVLKTERLVGCDLYVTLEPCAMCAGAISLARIKRLYIGATDKKGGAVLNGVKFYSDSTCHHRPEVYSGFLETESAKLLKQFFATKRLKE